MDFRKIRTIGGNMNRIGSPAPQNYEITVKNEGAGKYLSLQSKEFDGTTMKLIYGRANKPPSDNLFQKLKNAFSKTLNVRSEMEKVLTPVIIKKGAPDSMGTNKSNPFKATFFEVGNQASSSQKIEADRFFFKIKNNGLVGSHESLLINGRQANVKINVEKE